MARIFGREMGERELGERVGTFEQLGGIRAIRLDEGRARGVRAFDVRTATGMRFQCIADRALDIASLEYNGIPLAWHAPAGVAAPAFYDAHDPSFARNFFGGLVTTCGLNAFGPPGRDAWGEWGQHGRVNHLPAEELSHRTSWNGGVCTFEISGVVREAELFGESLRLERTWRAYLGSSRIELTDRVTNEGGSSVPHMLLYHCNGGFPLLDETTRLYVSHRSVAPRDERAGEGLDVWDRGGLPDADFAEQVFVHQPLACADGWARALIANFALNAPNGLALSVRFKPMQLSALFTWRMLGVKTYVMALEPANCATIAGRAAARAAETLPFIEPGEVRTYELTFDVLDNRQAIDAAIADVATADGAEG